MHTNLLLLSSCYYYSWLLLDVEGPVARSCSTAFCIVLCCTVYVCKLNVGTPKSKA